MKQYKGMTAESRAFKEETASSGKSDAVLSSVEEKILTALREEEVHDWGARRLLRKSGISNENAFYDALHSLKDKRLILMDRHAQREADPGRGRRDGNARLAFEELRLCPPGRRRRGYFHPRQRAQGGARRRYDHRRRYPQGGPRPRGRVRSIVEHKKAETTGTVSVTPEGVEVIPDNAIRYNLKLQQRDLNGAKDGDKVLVSLEQDYRGDWTRAAVQKVFGRPQRARLRGRDHRAVRHPDRVPHRGAAARRERRQCADSPRRNMKSVSTCAARRSSRSTAPTRRTSTTRSPSRARRRATRSACTSRTFPTMSGRIPCRPRGARARHVGLFCRPRGPDAARGALERRVLAERRHRQARVLGARAARQRRKDHGLRFKKTVINLEGARACTKRSIRFSTARRRREILEKYAPVMESLRTAKELPDILKENSSARGTMDFDSGESRFVLDENGVCIDIMPRVSGEAEQLIEQMMITANIAAAKFSLDHKLPFCTACTARRTRSAWRS